MKNFLKLFLIYFVIVFGYLFLNIANRIESLAGTPDITNSFIYGEL